MTLPLWVFLPLLVLAAIGLAAIGLLAYGALVNRLLGPPGRDM